jgi:hypothetical protein
MVPNQVDAAFDDVFPLTFAREVWLEQHISSSKVQHLLHQQRHIILMPEVSNETELRYITVVVRVQEAKCCFFKISKFSVDAVWVEANGTGSCKKKKLKTRQNLITNSEHRFSFCVFWVQHQCSPEAPLAFLALSQYLEVERDHVVVLLELLLIIHQRLWLH